ncbi:MAG: hypothetical protein K2G88_06545 [Oscillospiraceae bacterium]|nr:hypothetical protein [Oscillospiraceae bacterium]
MNNKKTNIAFKYNYCDGGKTLDRFGFDGICSDEIIRYNAEIAQRAWCSHADCPCKQYNDGKISEEKLLNIAEDCGGCVCQESGFFGCWCANAERDIEKDKPRRILQAQKNSLAILTTREPYAREDKRFIFAVFLIGEYFEGDDDESGYVKANPDWKIELTRWEAYKMPFWKYHANNTHNNAYKAFWGNGLFHYIPDAEAVQILRDITNVINIRPITPLLKTQEFMLPIQIHRKKHAEKFLQYYCEINHINAEDVPQPNGAILQ